MGIAISVIGVWSTSENTPIWLVDDSLWHQKYKRAPKEYVISFFVFMSRCAISVWWRQDLTWRIASVLGSVCLHICSVFEFWMHPFWEIYIEKALFTFVSIFEVCGTSICALWLRPRCCWGTAEALVVGIAGRACRGVWERDGSGRLDERFLLGHVHPSPLRLSFLPELHAKVEKSWGKPYSAQIYPYQHSNKD